MAFYLYKNRKHHHEVHTLIQNNAIYIYHYHDVLSIVSFVFVSYLDGLRQKVINQNSRNILNDYLDEKLESYVNPTVIKRILIY